MKVYKISQANEREAFLDFRRGRITGSKAKNVKMLSRGKDRIPAGFYTVLAEKLAIGKDGEPERERGLRLENEAITCTAKLFGLNVDMDCGLWVSDEDEDIMVSPDAAENCDNPTYAVEAKCLDSSNHLRGILQDMRAKKEEGYDPLNSLQIGTSDFRWQVIQYFVVNEDLKTVYFTLYDDRFAHDKLTHYVIQVDREHITDQIEAQRTDQKTLLLEMRSIIKELINE